MIARILTAGMATILVASSTLGAIPGAVAPPPSPFAKSLAAVPAISPQSAGEDEVVIPGGQRFIRSAAGMGAANPSRASGEDFLVELSRHLSAPTVLDYSERVDRVVDGLRELQSFLTELDESHGSVTPSLAEAGSPAYAKATELLRYLGFRVNDEGERIQLLRRVDQNAARLRQLMSHLGISVPLQSRLWAAGEPVVLNIQDELVPVLFGATAWNDQVFGEPLDGAELFDAFIADGEARKVLAAYANLDRPTRDGLFSAVGLAALHEDAEVATGFLLVSPYLRFADGEVLLPGDDRGAWEAILQPWTDTADLIERLVTEDSGKPAHLWRALSLIPAEQARYLLTMNHEAEGQRAAWANEMYRAIRIPDFGQMIRWPDDVAELFVGLRMRSDGAGIDWPGGAQVWLAAVDDDARLETDAELDALLDRFTIGPVVGPEVDAPLLRELIRDSEPDDDGPPAIRKYLAVTAAIRYQPISAMRRAIPLLYREYRRFGRAYGFFVTPTPLPTGSAEALLHHLQQVDAIEREEVRVDAIRQFQATLMLLHEIVLNDLLLDEDRETLLASFLALSPGTPVSGGANEGYGTAVTEWWRVQFLPAMARGLQANNWPGDPDDLRQVLVTSLVGRMGVSTLEVDGIDYNFLPANTFGRRMYTHLMRQEQPSFESLFRLDEIAMTLGGAGADTAAVADEIETIVAELRSQMPPNIGDEDVTKALPVTVARSQLFERSATLVGELRAGTTNPLSVQSFREAVSVYLGDALVGITYALNMGDPSSFTYQQAHIAWLHRLVIVELGGGGPQDLFSPWAATSESWILDEGSRLHNSLFGAPETLSRWSLEDLMPSGGSRDRAAAEAWASTFARIHVPSLTAEAQSVVARRHALATSWIEEAVATQDPAKTPSFWVTADRESEAPELNAALGLLMHPKDIERFEDAVRAGREGDALEMVTDGNRYLLLWALDNYDAEAPAAARWLIDQMVGMPVSRRGDYNGLMTPPPVPYGEAGDEVVDALMYTRLFDIRVRLAVLMDQEGLPAPLHSRLLMSAMASVLSTMTPANWEPWRNVLAAIDREVTDAALNQWVVDLAFGDELTPSDPNLALSALAGPGADLAGGPAGRTGALGVPIDDQMYEASYGAAVDMVAVDIGVWDGDDNFITDLTLDDLIVTSGGEPVTPAFLRLEGAAESSVFLEDLPEEVADKVTATPRNFVLVADMLSTSPQDWERILLEVTEFVRAGIQVDDQLALVTINSNGAPQVSHDFTINHERIAETLEAQIGNSFATSDREASFIDLSRILCDNSMCTPSGDDPESCEEIMSPRFSQCVTEDPDWEDMKFRLAQAQLGRWSMEAQINGERLMSALTVVASMLDLGDPYDRQKYVVLLSSGFERQPGSIHYSTLVDYANYSEFLNPLEVRAFSNDLSHKIVDLTDIMKRCRCTVYTMGTLAQSAFMETDVELGTSAPVVSRFSARSSLQGPLNALARDTGGKPFFGSDMGMGFQEVLEDTRLRYVLGFMVDAPEPNAESKWYDIEIDVQRDDVEVRARQGFWWPRR